MTHTEDTLNNVNGLKTRLDDHITFGARVSKKQMAKERFCYMHKWFEYRFMSPADATRKFADDYKAAYRRHWRETRSIDDADKKAGIRGDDWMSNSRELTSFWSARQHADTLGVPYPFFILRALEAAERRGARQPPRPNQLFKEQNLVHVLKEWKRFIDDGGFRMLDDPAYREENFRGLHAQIAYRDWIVERIKVRHARPDLIGRCVLLERVLPVDRATHEFGQDRLADARREAAGSDTAPVWKFSTMQILPACFGLAQVETPASEPCVNCPVRAACLKSAAMVGNALIARHGTLDPVGARALALNAARQQRFRDRQRTSNTTET